MILILYLSSFRKILKFQLLIQKAYIDASLFTKNAARITLSNNKQITISGADKFTYNLGSNITTGVESKDLTFTEFASAFGVEDILNSDGATEGIISDQYII